MVQQPREGRWGKSKSAAEAYIPRRLRPLEGAIAIAKPDFDGLVSRVGYSQVQGFVRTAEMPCSYLTWLAATGDGSPLTTGGTILA